MLAQHLEARGGKGAALPNEQRSSAPIEHLAPRKKAACVRALTLGLFAEAAADSVNDVAGGATTLTGNEGLGSYCVITYLLVCDRFSNRGEQDIGAITLFDTRSSEPP